MSARAPFEDTLARLAAIFEQRSIPYALMGGLAVAAWGAPRATEDVDLLAGTGQSDEFDRALRDASFSVDWRRGGSDDPIPREIIGRAVRLRLPRGLEIPVVAVEDLIILKLMAGGPGDLADVTDLLERASPLPELEKRAAARGVLELLRQVRASTGR